MSDYLSHHGVKGMKWGVRKDYPQVFTDNTYHKFLAVQFMKNHFNDAFLKEVKSRGYNALQDFNDAGGVSKSPIISLDLFAKSDAGRFLHGTLMSLRRTLKYSDNLGRAERIG